MNNGTGVRKKVDLIPILLVLFIILTGGGAIVCFMVLAFSITSNWMILALVGLVVLELLCCVGIGLMLAS